MRGRGEHDGVTANEVAEAILAVRQLVGAIALKTGETPRTLLDDEFTKAPSDEFWRATIGATL